MNRALAGSLVGLLAAVSLTACHDDFNRVDITRQPSKIGGDLTKSRLEVPVGMIVKAHLAPLDDDFDVMDANVTVADGSILEAAPVVSEADFAFIGLRPGATEITLRANGRTVLIIPAVVTEQRISPDTPGY
ncbi:MAG: hypothetical protein JST00_14115 [Deltaproteobacteria bacterium]|nr:hypothetical protein [Deltaproteobacteria bacterium]